jgi:hypothetical protein
MGQYSWEPEYCVYDVCKCGHAFMNHRKDSTECYNSVYFDPIKQEAVLVPECPCKKFRFSKSENFSTYTKKGDNQ